ncbi:MAG: IS21-like element helper ATPase IstB [Cyanobacteria bacterium REEB67]|nr:IS21-like element helper ATPase IstB [Cyanobacteria bacterium REEB67]
MLKNPTIDGLRKLKLHGMSKALEDQDALANIGELSFDDRLGLLVDAELLSRGNRQLQSRLKAARLRLSACVEDLDLKSGRGLDKTTMVALSSCDWLRLHRNVIVTGPTGSGKTYISCAFAQKACREGYSAIYQRTSKLFHDLALAKADGSYLELLSAMSKKDLLVLDDFALAPFTDEQRRDLLEIMEDRYNRRSTIVISQVPSDHWHDIIGDPTIADAILDRLIHNAHKIQLKTKVSKRKEEHGDLEF